MPFLVTVPLKGIWATLSLRGKPLLLIKLPSPRFRHAVRGEWDAVAALQSGPPDSADPHGTTLPALAEETGLGFWVLGLGFRVLGLGCRV